MSETRCQARFTPHGKQCEREMGHPGKHQADNKTVLWGGRYTPSDLSGKPGVMKDAAKDKAARMRKPRGQRCAVCCQVRDPSQLLKGQCADRQDCERSQPALWQ